ncbi:hypothetical protein DL769_001474 [Monosporascus sp. CRB-8-3]|nr:hypothetical protein DL769_001474 [Monosporascus sp. CRB-8-3]
MLAPMSRRWLLRPKILLLFALSAASLYFFLVHGSVSRYPATWTGDGGGNGRPGTSSGTSQSTDGTGGVATDNSGDLATGNSVGVVIDDAEDDVVDNSPSVKNKEDEIKEQFEKEYEELGKHRDAGAIFGNTLEDLDQEKHKHLTIKDHLIPTDHKAYYSNDQPYVYDPYPKYDENSWLKNHEPHVPCEGPGGHDLADVLVFKGHPRDFPEPSFGSYEVLGIDGNLCYERETRLGLYGYQPQNVSPKPSGRWNKVNWGQLQENCVAKNKARFKVKGEPNPYLNILDRRHNSTTGDQVRSEARSTSSRNYNFRRGSALKARGTTLQSDTKNSDARAEPRTALLLRSYTGKEYNENDKQVIRSLITELSLRTGGQYQVFLFVHVKDNAYAIWDDESTYQYVLRDSVPKEFRDLTILWNDEATQAMYPKLDPKKATVHVSQWLSVQKFAQEFPEFDYIWNWEMDARVIGHHYDFLEKLSAFAKKQPRRGLWERNERYYIPSIHGDYDTQFRKEVEHVSGKETIWGAPEFPFISPVGPKPPVADPADDNYEWGVGEEADLITVAPIFNPENSSWVSAPELWGFNDSSHPTELLPRRATIVTHSRVSKRLLDIMHVENLRGNHISSEMATQTTALLHGLKAVYAPMPMWFDRPWSGRSLAAWFNGGLKGESGGIGCAMGWGREGRYRGITWYYRATPPSRLYLNWMGFEDTDIGGEDWEDTHGRPCLPPMMVHPVKDVVPTEPGYKSESKLPYDD